MNCYLCGKSISDSEDTNIDHVPPSGFFLTKNPKGIKKLKTHERCNSDYSNDEQYVVNIIRATGNWDPTAERIWERRGKDKLLNPKRLGLVRRIQDKTRFINGLPVTQLEIGRVRRILDKIVRGLYFDKYNKTLESDDFKIDNREFLHKQGRWNVEEPSSISIGAEFEYFKRIIENGSLEYNLFFYNIHYFRLLYRKDNKSWLVRTYSKIKNILSVQHIKDLVLKSLPLSSHHLRRG